MVIAKKILKDGEYMNNLARILKKPLKELKPLYIIASEDRYLLNDFKDKFIESFVDEGSRDFNLTFLEEDETEDFPARLKNQINTPPIFAEKRFIIARTANYFTDTQKKEDLLISLFRNYPETTITLILVDGKIKQGLELVKAAKEIGEVLTVTAPRFAELDKWIVNEFKKRGKDIDFEGVKLLEQIYSNNLQRLETEIEKIVLYRMDKEKISLTDLLEIISRDKLLEDNLIFNLTDAVMQGKKAVAIRELKQMLAGGAIPLAILSTLNWQLRLLLSVKVLKKEGKTVEEIAKILKSHQYPVKKCYQYSDKFTEDKLLELLAGLLEANYNIVTGRYEPELALEMAIIG
jgi:DNA polymerase-3 subunit delta